MSNDWSKTATSNLVRRVSGVYYAQVKIAGRTYRRSLGTDKLKIARMKLGPKLAEIRSQADGAAVFGGAFNTLRAALDEVLRNRLPDVRGGSVRYYQNLVVRLSSELPADEPAAGVAGEVYVTWWRGCRQAVKDGTLSANYANTMLSWIKSALDLQVKAGQRVRNETAGFKRVSVVQKELELPSLADFRAVVDYMRSGGRPTSEESASLIEWMAYSGMRIGEVNALRWEDVGAAEIYVRPGKNGKGRRVPVVAALADLIGRMERAEAGAMVFSIKNPRKSLSNACAAVGVRSLCNHDMRHLFATVCIENGVDILTVAAWLGHQDGGVLALKVYGHLRDEHSQRAAKRVIFG